MDALMPGTDGFETCRRLKQNKALAHVPVIFMTGLSDTEHIIQGLEAGGVDYVTKPLVPGELLARIRVHLANARISHSARTALDAFGRFLLAASGTGKILWCTPQAGRLLGKAFRDFDTDQYVLPRSVQDWLQQCAAGQASSPPPIDLKADAFSPKLQLLYVGQIGPDENLLRLIEGDLGSDQTVLRKKLSVTEREAEVLLWIARGKSNRDIAEILSLSPDCEQASRADLRQARGGKPHLGRRSRGPYPGRPIRRHPTVRCLELAAMLVALPTKWAISGKLHK
jgi:DNA-binding response OmpR family regulator